MPLLTVIEAMEIRMRHWAILGLTAIAVAAIVKNYDGQILQTIIGILTTAIAADKILAEKANRDANNLAVAAATGKAPAVPA